MTRNLVQYHSHAPSEHTVGSRRALIKMHLAVPESGDDELAVIGVLIEEGMYTYAFDVVWQNLPELGDTMHLENVPIDVDDLLPDDRSAWRYHG